MFSQCENLFMGVRLVWRSLTIAPGPCATDLAYKSVSSQFICNVARRGNGSHAPFPPRLRLRERPRSLARSTTGHPITVAFGGSENLLHNCKKARHVLYMCQAGSRSGWACLNLSIASRFLQIQAPAPALSGNSVPTVAFWQNTGPHMARLYVRHESSYSA